MAVPTAVQRHGLAKLGYAMPDGSYYIRAGSVGASDLQNAIDAVGRGQDDSHSAIRVHIMKRAKALGLSSKIPGDWQPDGSLKHGDEDHQRADVFLEHFGITGMRWGHHLPGTEAVGGPGNGDSKPSPFIQRGNHPDGKSGDSGPSGQNNTPPAQQAHDAMNALEALHNKVSQQTEAARAEDEDAEHAPEPPSQQQTADQALQTTKSSPAPAKTAAKAPSAPPAKAIAKAPAKAATKAPAKAPAKAKPKSKLTKKQAAAAHAASVKHKAHVASVLAKAKQTAAKHKAAMAKMAKHPNTAQAKKNIAAANKLHVAQLNHLKQAALKAHAAHLAQMAKIKSPSHLSPKQKAAQLKAAKASAAKRHAAALAKKQTATAQAKRTTAQKVAYNKLKLNAQNNTLRLSMDDAVGTFLEHHGVKGMHWGVKKAREASLRGVKKTGKTVLRNPQATLAALAGARLLYDNRDRFIGTARVVAHIVKVMNEQRNSPEGKAALALGRAYVQGHVIHSDDSQTDEFLDHHGIKGMRWGVRRNGGHPGSYAARVPADSSEDHQQAALIKAKISVHKGIHALSNDELKALSERLNLEAGYHRLNPQTGKLDKGRKFVKTVTGDAKTVLDAVDTGRRVLKVAQGFDVPSSSNHQSKRTRNAPLKVVSVQ